MQDNFSEEAVTDGGQAIVLKYFGKMTKRKVSGIRSQETGDRKRERKNRYWLLVTR